MYVKMLFELFHYFKSLKIKGKNSMEYFKFE